MIATFLGPTERAVYEVWYFFFGGGGGGGVKVHVKCPPSLHKYDVLWYNFFFF